MNASSRPHTIHFHGTFDASEDGWQPVPPGGRQTYRITAETVGLHPYHCHTPPYAWHIAKGLYGAMIVDPPGGRPAAHEYVLVLSGWDLNGDSKNELYSWNGVAGFYHRFPIKVPVGELVRLYVANLVEYDPVVSFHLHAPDLRRLPERYVPRTRGAHRRGLAGPDGASRPRVPAPAPRALHVPPPSESHRRERRDGVDCRDLTRPHLVLTYDFPPTGGGIARWLAEMARCYPPGGMVVSTGAWAGSAASDAEVHQRVDRLPIHSTRLKTLPGTPALVPPRRRPRRASSAPSSPGAPTSSRPGIPRDGSTSRNGTPYGIIFHGTDLLKLEHHIAASSVRRATARAVIGSSAVCIVNSRWTAGVCERVLGAARIRRGAARPGARRPARDRSRSLPAGPGYPRGSRAVRPRDGALAPDRRAPGRAQRRGQRHPCLCAARIRVP